MLKDVIKALRLKKGYSQAQLARNIGVTQGAVSQWELGITYPKTDQMQALAGAFSMSLDELLGRTATAVSATSPGIPGLSPEEVILVERYRAASPERQNIIMEILSR